MFIQLLMDIDLILPLLKAAKKRKDLCPVVCLSNQVTIQVEGLEGILQSLQVGFQTIRHDQIVSGTKPHLNDIDALISASESTANPHRAAHVLTKRANETGIRTYTLQHGFENVGLTYSDHIHSVENIRFASQKIFIWGPIEKLHENIPEETKRKCVPVGCCKDVITDFHGLAKPGNREFLVAVFENLHWHRYTEEYRSRFLSDLEETARKCRDTTFVIKPHPAGRWLTQRYRGPLPKAANIIVAQPQDLTWKPYTGPVLVGIADGMVTTPSTVALDAARAGRPVIVVGYDLDLKSYRPLPIIQLAADWQYFVDRLHVPEERCELEATASCFLKDVLLDGDASSRILDCITADLSAVGDLTHQNANS